MPDTYRGKGGGGEGTLRILINTAPTYNRRRLAIGKQTANVPIMQVLHTSFLSGHFIDGE